MAEVVIMPKLGFNMDEGQLVKWHKQVGETVKKGEVLFEINTDKTTMPVEATEDRGRPVEARPPPLLRPLPRRWT